MGDDTLENEKKLGDHLSVQKELPLRRRRDKPILKYSKNGKQPQVYKPAELHIKREPIGASYVSPVTNITGLFTPPFLQKSTLATSFSYLGHTGQTNSQTHCGYNVGYTGGFQGNYTSNIASQLSGQQTPVSQQKYKPVNPYARPMSAVQADADNPVSVLHSMLKSATSNLTHTVSTSNSSLGSTGSINNNNPSPQSAPNASAIQTNSFMKPQTAVKSSTKETETTFKTQSPSPTIGKIVEIRDPSPPKMPPKNTRPLSAKVLHKQNSKTKAGHRNSNEDISHMSSSIPKPGTAGQRKGSGVAKKTSGVTYEFTEASLRTTLSRPGSATVNLFSNTQSGKPPPGPSAACKSSSVGSPSASAGSRAANKPGTTSSSPCCSRMSSYSNDFSNIKVRNLRYTPNKPYQQIMKDDKGEGDTKTSDNSNINNSQPTATKHKHLVSDEKGKEKASIRATPSKDNTTSGINSKTVFYRKAFKNEEVIHDLNKRQRADGAPSTQAHPTERNYRHRRPKKAFAVVEDVDDDDDDDDDEWEDERETFSPPWDDGFERLPGDGEDSAPYEDDDYDDPDDESVMNGLDDDFEQDSDISDDNSLASGSQSRNGSTTRIKSATKRLLGLSLKDKAGSGDAKARTIPKSRSASSISVSSDPDLQPALTPSLFRNVPPTINFVTQYEKIEQLPWEIRKLLKWRMSPITPNIVKNTIARSGFKPSKKNYDWLGYWGKHMKSQGFKAIREYQKVNHFPGSFQIGRKDKLWKNLSRMQAHYGKKEFNFFPLTYCLPADLKLLKKAWEEGGSKQKWILKPPASARGIGIKVINKWNQIPKKKPVLVQKYLSRPYLINESKFDMRIYVYVTCYDPLRIYVYEDGLARFASCKYSNSMKNINNRYMHLTNYSINKKNTDYESNGDETLCQGHKWSLKSLWGFMRQQGHDTNRVWTNIVDLIIKTIISSESCVNSLTKANTRRRYCVHELFGFDVMLDENLKPWIIEVNISPSLHSNSQLDINIKGGMIKDLLNLTGFMIPDKSEMTPSPSASDTAISDSGSGSVPELPAIVHDKTRKFVIPSEICINKKLFPNSLASDERAKRSFYCQRANDDAIQSSILEILTPDDARILIETVDEDSRRGRFQRVFPSVTSHKYLHMFECPRYYNLLMDMWIKKYYRMENRGDEIFTRKYKSHDGKRRIVNCSLKNSRLFTGIALLETLSGKGIQLENPTEDPKHQWVPPVTCYGREHRVISAPPTPIGKTDPGLPKLRKKKVIGVKSTNSLSSTSITPRAAPTRSAASLDPS